MTKMFSFEPSQFAPKFAAEGYVHIPHGLSEAFHQILLKQVEEYRRVSQLKEWAIGDKQQSLYQFPEHGDYRTELCKAVAAVTGLDANRLVLSERHIKDYDPNAKPNPLAHKDRYATEIAVGFSVHVSPESELVFYPTDDVSVNPFNSSAELRASLPADQLPEVLLKSANRIAIHDEARDVFMFRGNAIWHLRSKPAGTTMLYFKINSFHCDPLGEDPLTPEFRTRTETLLSASDAELEQLIPILGRRVDFVHRRFNRHWQEVLGVVLWGEKHLSIDESELLALKAMDERRNVRSVIAKMGVDSVATGLAKIRRLAALGIVDLLHQPVVLPVSVPHLSAAPAIASPASAGALLPA